MVTRILHKEITDCSRCPECYYDNYYGNFDNYYGISLVRMCRAIARTIGRDIEKPPIPDWCPLPIKEEAECKE